MEAIENEKKLGVEIVAVLVRFQHQGKNHNLDAVIEQRLVRIQRLGMSILEFVVGWIFEDFDGERGESNEAFEGEGRVRERAMAESEEQELEVSEPSDEEGESTSEMNRVKIERKTKKEVNDRQKREESKKGFIGRKKLAYEKAIAQTRLIVIGNGLRRNVFIKSKEGWRWKEKGRGE
ncbi:Acyl-CoA--sterol O-acyltransferase 1 [Senna tora]|uniref:Acyl-CoA--sterol O-acyltransferase 1 n=1 Tax=Senna tora TaxID=362788 RepID=A0A835CGC8_9FABA|nr:Acyl-CoA--sterol O-acyltransferase 1 [Senna tora]